MNTKALPLVALASLVVSLVACAAEVQTPSTGENDPAPSGTSPSTPSAKPEYAFSCQGAASPLSVSLDLDVRPRCVGARPDSGTFGADVPNCGPSCNAQDVEFRYEPPAMRCGSKDLFYWDGKACLAKSTAGEGGMLRCKGADCNKLYASKEDCEGARSTCAR